MCVRMRACACEISRATDPFTPDDTPRTLSPFMLLIVVLVLFFA